MWISKKKFQELEDKVKELELMNLIVFPLSKIDNSDWRVFYLDGKPIFQNRWTSEVGKGVTLREVIHKIIEANGLTTEYIAGKPSVPATVKLIKQKKK